MTDEQINKAIAEACPNKFRTENDVWFFQYDKDCWSQCHNNSICNDLNAMHEAEKVLDYEKCEAFSNAVADIVHAANREKDYPFPWCFARIHATARERAEAFLRTLGKWEEVQG